ncbi:hypothetical protein BLNAU_4651 [Blattamonas nauphoetae]|uniref:KxDL domain-containing protein n=1 Tax=Blattamonas nauphoetae TaxID=2049346 RepID=A0ABQ9Y9Q8_9EUKA|nr:hypothetical protein BLNAU_4651 [Blattamonas nauphoetae]
MAEQFADSLVNFVDHDSLKSTYNTQQEILKNIVGMNERIETFNVTSDKRLSEAQSLANKYMAQMKGISLDLNDIFVRVRTLRKLLHQKYPDICPDIEAFEDKE